MYKDQVIGEIIKKLRKKSGYTMAIVAEKLGLDKSTISLYESGKRTISTPMFFELLDLYGADHAVVAEEIVHEHKKINSSKIITTNDEIANALKNARIKHGYSAEQFADVLGMPVKTYEMFENGKKIIYAIQLRNLSEYFNIEENEFYPMMENKNTK